MIKPKLIWIFLIIAIVFVVAYWTIAGNTSATVQGTIVDELSNGAVWQAWISVGEKSTIKFKGTTYKLTGIQSGKYDIKVNAPYYHDFKERITLNSGINILNIKMRGIEVAGLDSIIAFTETSDKGIGVEIRLLDDEKNAIVHHPALEMKLEGTLYLNENSTESKVLGRALFRGPIEMFWDPEELLAYNKGLIPWEKIDFKPKESEQYGTMEIKLYTPQGNFQYVIKEIELFKQARVK